MEGISGRRDFSCKEMATWLCAFEDELDIVGKGIIDDSVNQDYFEDYLPHC